MTDKTFQDEVADINLSLKPFDEATAENNELPPPYEYPKIGFSTGWKDRGFAIMFWVYMIVVIIIALAFGITVLPSFPKGDILKEHFNKRHENSFDLYMKVAIYALGGVIAVATLTSFLTYFLLQLCAGRIVMCTFIISIAVEGILGVVLLYTVHWGASIPPFTLLFFTLIFICCVRKRIPFAKVHLRVACAVLRSYPSLIFVAFVLTIVEFLWLIFCVFMEVGVQYALYTFTQIDSTENSLHHTHHKNNSILHSIIGFIILSTWCWGAIVLANIVHFVTACTVGHWWFGNNTQQLYTLRNSIKRTLTTNFGTICLGSLLEAILKAAHSSTENRSSWNILTCITWCILRILEKIIGYINEWAFIYAALTEQSFVQASRSFIGLFKKRGWTMVINDKLVEYCLEIINLLMALTSAVTGGLFAYIFVRDSSELIVIIASCMSFLIGLLFSVMTTTILTSCVRTIFVCFALNPAALGATHPEHLQHLTKVWHKFYPKEFSSSGYADCYPMLPTADNV